MQPTTRIIALADVNPLLKTDLSKEISTLQRQYVKNEILFIISYIAFFAIASVAIWYSAFFALSSLPLVLAGITVTLSAIHSLFAHPCKLAADQYAKALSMEKRVVKRLEIYRHDPIKARYEALRKDTSLLLDILDAGYHTPPEYTKKGAQPTNYAAYKKAYKQGNLEKEKEDSYRTRLSSFRADKDNILDSYLSERCKQMFLCYAAINHNRKGSYELIGTCHRNSSTRFDDAFFTFDGTTFHIYRKPLINEHRDAVRSLINGRRPENVFTDNQWAIIQSIVEKIPLDQREKRVYRQRDLIPYAEMIVNAKYIPVFEKYDPHSFKAIFSRILLTEKNPEEFTPEEIAQAKQIASTLTDPDREIQFRDNPTIRQIVEAKIRAILISSSG